MPDWWWQILRNDFIDSTIRLAMTGYDLSTLWLHVSIFRTWDAAASSSEILDAMVWLKVTLWRHIIKGSAGSDRKHSEHFIFVVYSLLDMNNQDSRDNPATVVWTEKNWSLEQHSSTKTQRQQHGSTKTWPARSNNKTMKVSNRYQRQQDWGKDKSQAKEILLQCPTRKWDHQWKKRRWMNHRGCQKFPPDPKTKWGRSCCKLG